LSSLIQFIVRFGIGGKGLSIFAIPELTHIMKARKSVVDINIDSSGSGSSRVVKKTTVIQGDSSGDEEEVKTIRRVVKRAKKRVVKRSP